MYATASNERVVFADGSLSKLLNPMACDPETELFQLHDQAIGFCMTCTPLSGVLDGCQERLTGLFSLKWPPGSIIHFNLYGSPDISDFVNSHKLLRRDSPVEILNKLMEERREWLQDATKESLQQTGMRIRNMVLYVSATIPTRSMQPTEFELQETVKVKNSLLETMSALGARPKIVKGDDLVKIYNTILSPTPTASWTRPGQCRADASIPLREQFHDTDCPLRIERSEGGSRLQSGKTIITTMSVKEYPLDDIYFGFARSMIGDPLNSLRGLPGTVMLSTVIHIPDQQKKSENLFTRRSWVVNQCKGSLPSVAPVLPKKLEAFDNLTNKLNNGERVIEVYCSVTLFSESENERAQHISNAQGYFQEIGINLLPDEAFVLPIFLANLPMNAEVKAIPELERFRTMTTGDAVCLLPMFAEWKGVDTPVMNFVGRGGQLIGFDLFASKTNKNIFVAAESGAGKSFLANDMITNYLSTGGMVWAIDAGGSYKEICGLLEGDYISFEENSNICLNPFPLIDNFDEQIDGLLELLKAMATKDGRLDDFQQEALKALVSELWEVHGNDLSIDLIAEACADHNSKKVMDIGVQMYSFTTKGNFGKFFNGPNTIDFTNNFTVLELGDLKQRKELQKVVLLQLMIQILSRCYKDELKSIQKLFLIDEAWSLLCQGDISVFIEDAYRRIRKYNGSIGVITQGIADLHATDTGRVIMENSAHTFLLRQQSTVIDAAVKNGHISLNDYERRLMKSVSTVPFMFSECYLRSNLGAGVVRLVVPPMAAILYSTTPEDVDALRVKREVKGLTQLEAIYEMLDERMSAMRR